MAAQTIKGVRLTAANDNTTWTDTSVNIGSTTGPVSFFALAVANSGSSTVSIDAISINGQSMTLEADRSLNDDIGVAGRWRAARLDNTSISGALTIIVTKSTNVARPNLVLCWSDQCTGIANVALVNYAAGASFSASVASNASSQAAFLGIFNASVSVTPTSPTVFPQHATADAIGFFNSSTELRLGALARPGATSSTLQAALAHLFTPGAIGYVASFAGVSTDTTPPTVGGPGGATGSTAAATVTAGATAVHTYTADEAVTWSINGGANASLFSIGSSTGALVFNSASTAGVYVVGVRATDTAGNATTQTLTCTVNATSGGTITSSPLVRNTGAAATDAWALWAAGESFTAWVHHRITGALLVKRTGLLTNSLGVVAFTDAAVPSAATCRIDYEHEATGVLGVEVKTAS